MTKQNGLYELKLLSKYQFVILFYLPNDFPLRPYESKEEKNALHSTRTRYEISFTDERDRNSFMYLRLCVTECQNQMNYRPNTHSLINIIKS